MNSWGELIEALGGKQKVELFPVLSLEGKTHRSYIDYLEAKDLKHAVMKGKDQADRPFVSLKLELTYNENKFNERKEIVVVTVFQRYSDSDFPWVMGGQQSRHLGRIEVSEQEEREGFLKRIRNLMDGQSIPSDWEKNCTVKLVKSI